MFKGHPKGLYVIFFSNMGERFGYYTMMAIFALFFEAKFGLHPEDVGFVWSGFLTAVYALPVLGGILADRIGYGRIVSLGIILMFSGYFMMSVPGTTQIFIYISLFVIALGTGFFKGNLAVILGNLYERADYKPLHDHAFNIYYMGINIGAFFAPYAATGMRDILMGADGFTYDARVPGMAHQFLKGTLESGKLAELKNIALQQMGDGFTSVSAFCQGYIDSLSAGYNAGFAIAGASIVISLLIFLGFRKYYKHADYLQKDRLKADPGTVQLTPKQVRDRLVALILVFVVVIFFWMAFHQNGLTLTWFAKNYTAGSVSPFTKIFFDIWAFLAFVGIIASIIFLAGRKFTKNVKLFSIALLLISGGILYSRYITFSEGSTNPISPELFQSFNPMFVVFLTPVVVAFFAWLGKKGKEPSTPKRMAFGMLITAVGFMILVVGSFKLASPQSLLSQGGVSELLVSPYWLISTYFTLTVAELNISPMGLAFVAKVSPPQFRGMMQGGWLGATAVGNGLSGLVAIPWSNLSLVQTFGLLVATSLVAAILMFSILRILERATKS